MDSFEKQEYNISRKLRQYCDNKDGEINLKETGQLLNEMGLLYKTRGPDKISLI